MQTKKKIGAALVLLALALAIVPAAVFWFHASITTLCLIGLGIGGTVTVTYQSLEVGSTGLPSPGGGYAGGTVPPTNIQMIGINSLIALVNLSAVGDSAATLTHNMQISALGLANLQPYIVYYIQALSTATSTAPVFTFALTNSNVVTMNDALGGAIGTFVVRIIRG